jgi:hypothetical protein
LAARDRLGAAGAADGAAVVVVATGVIRPWPSTQQAVALPIRPAVTARDDAQAERNPRRLLRSAAAAVEAAPPAAGSGTVIYQRLIAGYLHTAGGENPASVLVPETTEEWVRPNGSGEIRHVLAAPIWPSSADERAWKEAGAPVPTGERTDRFDRGLRDGVRYSDRPAELSAQLRALPEIHQDPRDATAQLFVKIHEILREPAATPALRAALYRVAATLPGLTAFGAVTDQLGRPGIAVGIDSDYAGGMGRYQLIFDEDTGKLLEYQELLLERASFVQADPPTQIGFEIVAEHGTTSAVGRRPSDR